MTEPEPPAVPDREARRARRDAESARRDAEAEQRALADARIDAAAAAAPSVLPGGVGEALAAVLAAMKPFRAADGYLAFSAVGRSSDEVVALAEAVLAVPDTGQAREQILQRDITFGEYVIAVCDAIGLPHDSPRAAVVEAIRAAVAGAQAPESPTDSTPKAGRWGSGEAETTTTIPTARLTEWAGLLRQLSVHVPLEGPALTRTLEAAQLMQWWAGQEVVRDTATETNRTTSEEDE